MELNVLGGNVSATDVYPSSGAFTTLLKASGSKTHPLGQLRECPPDPVVTQLKCFDGFLYG